MSKVMEDQYLLLLNSKSLEDVKPKPFAYSSVTFPLHCCASDKFQYCLRNNWYCNMKLCPNEINYYNNKFNI